MRRAGQSRNRIGLGLGVTATTRCGSEWRWRHRFLGLLVANDGRDGCEAARPRRCRYGTKYSVALSSELGREERGTQQAARRHRQHSAELRENDVTWVSQHLSQRLHSEKDCCSSEQQADHPPCPHQDYARWHLALPRCAAPCCESVSDEWPSEMSRSNA